MSYILRKLAANPSFRLVLTLLAITLLPLFVAAPAVHATEALTISLSSNNLALNLMPHDSAGSFGSSDLGVSVSLNITSGYTLSIIGSDDTGNLVGQNNSSNVFSSITSTVSETDFSAAANTSYNGKWGYKVSKNSATNNNYVASPTTTSTTIDTVTNFSGTNNYTFTIGARANDTTPVDNYSATFVISAVSIIACNSTATNISDAICMQDMNDSVINSMVEGTQYRLLDNRDNKLYYIAKMKDGRVWMTQNLDLDLETAPNKVAALTSDNTNLTTAYATDGTTLLPGYSVDNGTITFTPSAATSTTASDWKTSTSGTTNYNTLPQSFDYGDYYRYTDANGTSTTYSGDNARANCDAAHPDGSCDHFHAGNYYDWTAAVAMNNTNSTSNGGVDNNYYNTGQFTAANSICPKGWRLPRGRTSNTATDVGYYSEINYTWFTEDIVAGLVSSNGTAGVYSEDGYNRASNGPLYLARTGYKSNTSSPSNSTTSSYYWANTVNTSSTGYSAYTNSSAAPYPLTNNNKYVGLAVRCVATPSANTGSTVITFDKNAVDAAGTMNTQSINANSFTNLTANSFTRTGYAFNSWNTEPDGSGRSYADAAQYYAKVGTATTNVTLYAQWDKLYTITFNVGSNTDSIIFDGTAYTNGQTTTAIDGKSYVIGGNYPTKYGFNSWSVTAGTLENSNAAATNYTVSGDATITLTGQEATTSISSVTAGSVPSNCKNLAVNPQLVYDPRDNEAYWVAQLCDGKVWMLDNLRLDLTDSTVINNLSSTNTNATDAQLAYLKGISTGTTTDQYPTAGLSGSEWSSSHSYSVPQVAARFKNDMAPVVFGLGSGKIGVYYNYCATSAGTYCWGNGTSSTGSPTSDPKTSSYRDIEGDICPAGWHLPTGTNSGQELYALYSAYSGGGTLGGQTTLSQAVANNTALSTPLSGYVNSGSQSNLGTRGILWSSTWLDSSYMLSRYVYATSVSGGNGYRNNGYFIRCVLGSS